MEQVPAGVLESLTKYIKLLREHAYFDYTSVLLSAVGLLEDVTDAPALRVLHDHVRDLRFVVVDEYQDVNPIQEAW